MSPSKLNNTSLSKSSAVSSAADQQQQQQAMPLALPLKDTTCVVCFKIVDIFSIGECDHPVCYECSTRMRVLCKQNECPICRRLNQKVIFTSEILPYRELDQKNRSCLYDKTFRICFTGQREQNAFLRLLEHTCNKCNKSLPTALTLKDHLRKDHELFYCDICTENLKIFSFERRAYTREQLAQHRRKGDPDNKSHRGHPLCEYCDVRYLDRDELFRHLRKEHYFCHFCDADGSNQFYADHQSLRSHFLQHHFLCEEGDCMENIFTAAFRTEIDLKAHKAQLHGQNSKQARTLEFQFTLAPRNRSNQQQRHEEENTGSSYIPSQNTTTTASSSAATTSNPLTSKMIDARNEQEFPSLGNAPAVVLRPVMALNIRNTVRGLARTKENFPALGGANSVEPSPRLNNNQNNHNKSEKAASALFKNLAVASTAAAIPSTSKLKSQPSAQQSPTTSNSSSKTSSNSKPSLNKSVADFPALPGSSSGSKGQWDLDDDLIFTPPAYNVASISSKHRALVPSYESISSGASSSKLTTVQRNEVKTSTSSGPVVAPAINSKHSFPALGKGSTPAPPPQWLTRATQAKKAPQMSRKLKVAPAPLLEPTPQKSKAAKVKTELVADDKTKAKLKEKNKENEEAKTKEAAKQKEKKKKVEEKEKPETTKANKKEANNKKGNNTNNSNNSIGNSNGNGHNNTDSNSVNISDKTSSNNEIILNSKNNTKSASDTNSNNNKGKSKKANKSTSLANALNILASKNEQNASSGPETNTNLYSAVTAFKAEPPSEKADVPKTEAVISNSVDLVNDNSLLFTYMSPSSSTQRNMLLATHLEILLSPQVSEEFRNMSRLYRSNDCNARTFFTHCRTVMKNKFDDIFPELLSLLPDIDKQQELYNVYLEYVNRINGTHSNQLKACDLCKQVVKSIDFNEHWQYHVDMERDNHLNRTFPTLNVSGGTTKK